jgi:hypothetical protein
VCTGGACKGTVKLLVKTAKIGSGGYSAAAGHTVKITFKLNAAGKKQLKLHKHGFSVKLVIAPSSGAAVTITIKLKVKG